MFFLMGNTIEIIMTFILDKYLFYSAFFSSTIQQSQLSFLFWADQTCKKKLCMALRFWNSHCLAFTQKQNKNKKCQHWHHVIILNHRYNFVQHVKFGLFTDFYICVNDCVNGVIILTWCSMLKFTVFVSFLCRN